MSSFFEEYGYTIAAAVCAAIVAGWLVAGIFDDGSIAKLVTILAQEYAGG